MNWKMERKKLSELKPAEYNPREIRPEAIEGLGGSIDRFGVLVPIIWNKRSGNIVGGHQRYKVLQNKGVEETDVVVVDLDVNDEVALNITMNNPSTRGTFTKDVVTLLQDTEKTMSEDFKAVGLADMLNYLSRFKFDQPESGGKKGGSGGGGGGTEGPKEGLRCPRCRSIWKKADGEIVQRNGAANV